MSRLTALAKWPLEIAASLRQHRGLLVQLVRREIIGRYRGSMLGIAWSFFHPLIMLAVYTFVFSVVFKARWGVGDDEGKTTFAVILFVGLIMHGIFAEVVNRAPLLILNNVNYVKKVVFPLELLPWVSMGSALFHAAISFLVLIMVLVAIGHPLHASMLQLPFVLLPLVLGTMGVAWLLASLGVYIRDVGQNVTILTTIMLFMAPVFYPMSALPPDYQLVLMLNPLTYVIEDARGVLLLGRSLDWTAWGLYMLGSMLVMITGFAWFQKTRRGFADVL
jgi:lipopolysaccharide transport system permease protein